jgi:hypothetical protein
MAGGTPVERPGRHGIMPGSRRNQGLYARSIGFGVEGRGGGDELRRSSLRYHHVVWRGNHDRRDDGKHALNCADQASSGPHNPRRAGSVLPREQSGRGIPRALGSRISRAGSDVLGAFHASLLRRTARSVPAPMSYCCVWHSTSPSRRTSACPKKSRIDICPPSSASCSIAFTRFEVGRHGLRRARSSCDHLTEMAAKALQSFHWYDRISAKPPGFRLGLHACWTRCVRVCAPATTAYVPRKRT